LALIAAPHEGFGSRARRRVPQCQQGWLSKGFECGQDGTMKHPEGGSQPHPAALGNEVVVEIHGAQIASRGVWRELH